jgi:hypothetical protein
MVPKIGAEHAAKVERTLREAEADDPTPPRTP